MTKLTESDDLPSALLEEIQLYNVALKQEDGEQLSEDDISALYQVDLYKHSSTISALYQDAALRLRTSLRTKVPTRAPQQRKSLRYKIMKMSTTEADPETSQVEGVGFRDLKRILAKHKLPTEEEELQNMELTGMLGRTQAAFLAKVCFSPLANITKNDLSLQGDKGRDRLTNGCRISRAGRAGR